MEPSPSDIKVSSLFEGTGPFKDSSFVFEIPWASPIGRLPFLIGELL